MNPEENYGTIKNGILTIKIYKMTKQMFAFPSIDQLKSVVMEVKHRARYIGNNAEGYPLYDDTIKLPTLKFRGSEKLHGTNASICYDWQADEIWYQSRERIITPLDDNAGFAQFATAIDFKNKIKSTIEFVEREVIKIYGEWCGGSIQKGVALNQLPKIFVIFGVKNGEEWLSEEVCNLFHDPEERIYSIYKYSTWNIEIDFSNPSKALDIINDWVDSVEKESPFGLAHGVSGIGEGIVFRCITEGYLGSRFIFKAKGEKHKTVHEKRAVVIDVEKANNKKELVEKIVTEARLLQGIDKMKEANLEISRKNLGFYLKWLSNDAVTEELAIITESGFEVKEITGEISSYGRNWFFEYENKLIME